MTESEKIRAIVAVILVLIIIARRFDLLGKLKERQAKKKSEEEKQRLKQKRKDLRAQQKERIEQKKNPDRGDPQTRSRPVRPEDGQSRRSGPLVSRGG